MIFVEKSTRELIEELHLLQLQLADTNYQHTLGAIQALRWVLDGGVKPSDVQSAIAANKKGVHEHGLADYH